MLYPQCALDPDGYLVLPYEARCKVGPAPIIAPTMDHALGLYRPEAWSRLVAQFEALPDLRYEARLLVELLRSNASETVIGTDDMIRIPTPLRRLAHIDEQVLVVSAEDHIQIWNPQLWQGKCSESYTMSRSHGVA